MTHYSPWADNTETISRLDRIACLFIVIYVENIHKGIIKRINPFKRPHQDAWDGNGLYKYMKYKIKPSI